MLPVALLGLLSALPPAEAPARPNILFIFTDDHASHAISAYGSKINRTPHLDRLAREGMLFRNCFCTNGICAPSRAVILTGKHSHLNGVLDNRVAFDGRQQHVGKLLGQAGYQTALLGKWHLKSDPTGFDRWAVLSGAGGQGTYYNPEFNTDRGPLKVTGYCTDIVTDLALDWLKARDTRKPFFLMYQHKAPHRSWEPGPGQLGLYRDGEIPEPATLFDDHAGLASPARKQEMTVANHLSAQDLKLTPPRNLTPEQRKVWDAAYQAENEAFARAKLTGKDLTRWHYQRYIKDYLRCVAGVDDNLGRVLKYLDDNGLARNTIVIYSSDQGFFLGDRGWYDKRWMYEESLRMPLLVRWPAQIKPGSENRDLAQNLDFAPTFCDLAGIKPPADMQGASLLPLFRGAAPASWRKSIYYHYYEFPGPHSVARHYGVRTATHKLIHYYKSDEWELFDLDKDPGERRSVHADPAHAEVREKLAVELKRLRKQYQVDTFDEEKALRPKKSGVTPPKGLGWRYEFGGERLPFKLVKARVDTGADGGLILRGDGHVALGRPAEDPTGQALVVGGRVWLDGNNGVIVAWGGEAHGLSLFIEDGIPTFAVRCEGKLTRARGSKRLPRGRWTQVLGELTSEGRLRVWVNGKPDGEVVQGSLLAAHPADGLSIGADTGSQVGDYRNPHGFTGRLRDLRLYWGSLDPREIRAWARQPD
ncbi:MAG: sulfatase-like hydrolase/transferase [Gemmataceae bacterium]